MSNKASILYRVPFYPFLVGLYPVVFLWQKNFFQIQSFVVPYTLLLAVDICVPVIFITWLVVRRMLKAAVISSFILLMFYAYGPVFSLVDNLQVAGFIIGRHRYILPFWFLIIVVGTILILHSKSDFRNVTWVLNLTCICLVSISIVQIGYWVITSPVETTHIPGEPAANKSLTAGTGPDVYYIILDAYGRQDLLLNGYHLDTSGFIQQLKDLGFVFPDCTQSNYDNTAYSMSSSLNMDYLDHLGFTYKRLLQEDPERLLTPLVKNNQVEKKFADMGYTTITFHTPYSFANVTDSDIYYDFEETTLASNKLETLSFRYLFLRNTMMRALIEEEENNPQLFDKLPPDVLQIINPQANKFTSRNYGQYQQMLYQLDALEKIPEIPGKKFVYAHMLMTHMPFTFNADGSFRGEFRDSTEGYLDQIRFTDTRILQIVKTILTKSSNPPIIVIQADHSWAENDRDRPKILNAYYLPDGGSQKVYPNISPVNTFRLIFNQYFGGNYPLLPDTSFVFDKKYPNGTLVVPPSCIGDK